MEFEYWWLLAFPLFFGLGWLAARIDIKQIVSESRALPGSYFKGLNFLLNEEPDKAIEAFIEVVKVDPQTVTAPSGSDLPNLQRHLVFALYTGDFRRSNYQQATAGLGDSSVPVQPLTMCVKPEDKLIATVWGYDDRPVPLIPFTPDFNAQDVVLRGTSLVMDGPGFGNGAQDDPAPAGRHAPR